MSSALKTTLLLVLAITLRPAVAQYSFASKSDAKLYEKLEKYYEEANYAKILSNEDRIATSFFPKRDTLTALMYSYLGESYYYQIGDVLRGVEFYEKEYALRKELGAIQDENFTAAVYTLASLLDEVGKYARAEELYLELLSILDKKDPEYVSALLPLLDHYTITEEADRGLSILRKNRNLIDKGSYNEAMSLRFEGDYLEMRGEFSRSKKRYLKSLEVLEDAGYFPSREYINIMNALGLLYVNKSQLPEAEEIFKEAQDILDRMGGDNEVERAGTEFNLAQVYFEYGLYEQALASFLSIYESDKSIYGEDSYTVAVTEFVIGDIYLESGDFENAEKYLTSSKSKLEALGETQSLDYARSLNNLMRLAVKKADFDQAQALGNQMLAVYKEVVGDEHHSYALALSNYSDIAHQRGDLKEAERILKNVQKIRAKRLGENHPLYAKSLRKLAILKWKQDDLGESLNFYNKTFDNYFNQINTFFPILSEQEKSKFYYNQLRPTFEQFNSFVVEKNSENKELVGKMYDYQLATKGLVLYATNKVRESILDSNDSSLIQQYNTWIGQKEQLSKLFSSSDIAAEERDALIDSLSRASNELEKQLSKQSSAFADVYSNRQISWKSVQAKLKPGEAAVEMIRFRDFDPDSAGIYTDEVYYAALVLTSETKDYPEMVVMRNGKLMEKRYLSNYRNAIKYQVNENYSYQLFWKPLSHRLKNVNKIYFSPDGVYNQISIYTLQNPDTKLFTIDEFEIQLVNNTKDLLSYDFDKRSSFDKQSYLFGFPNYNLGAIEEEEQKESFDVSEISKAAAENRGSRSVRGTRGARGSRGNRGERGGALTRGIPRGVRGNLLRYMRSNQFLALLPGTKREVNLINGLYEEKEQKPTIYLSDEALEERIKEVEKPQTLHIATHGFFLESEESEGQKDSYVENPLLRSGLILAGANSYLSTGVVSEIKDYREDGVLTAYEAMNLNLDDTELVVLSACETGLGEIKNGEGVFGLQRAFQVAGADAIIMSMWTVDDDATQELMTFFYEEWLSTGKKHESFITAQKRLKEKRPAPFYWGAFVMVGN